MICEQDSASLNVPSPAECSFNYFFSIFDFAERWWMREAEWKIINFCSRHFFCAPNLLSFLCFLLRIPATKMSANCFLSWLREITRIAAAKDCYVNFRYFPPPLSPSLIIFRINKSGVGTGRTSDEHPGIPNVYLPSRLSRNYSVRLEM